MRILAGCLILLAWVVGLVWGDRPAHEGPTGECRATKELHGRELEIRVVGRQLPCSHVRRIVSGPCRDGKVWSCFSFHPPDPVLVWFRERERFQLRYSTAIEARRYPCGQARVTRRAWARAYHSSDPAFPTRAQVLADDLIRCRQLRGLTRNEVTELLGPPESSVEEGDFLEYTVGKQRDSFFQLDSERLSIGFDRRGVFKSAELVPG